VKLQTVKIDNRGMSLIEVLAAILILMIVWLALMQMSLIGYRENMKNILRDEAINVAEVRMNELRNLLFDDGLLDETAGTTEAPVERKVRASFGTFPFTPTRTISILSADTKQVTISVAWSWKKKNFTHTITSIVREP